METYIMALLGGMNIVQLFSYRQLKRKIKADADLSAVEAKKAECQLANDQYDFLISKLQYFQVEYFNLLEKVNDTNEEHLSIIEKLNNEILSIRTEVKKYKLLSCSRTSCQQRIQ